VALAPEEASGWHGRGQAHLELGEYDAAFRDIARAAEVAPANSLYFNNLAWQLATCPREDLRDTRRALALAQRAVLLGPRSAESWNTLGAAYYRAGRWADAVGSLRESLRRQGGNGWDWFFLAMAHWQLGEKDTARRYHQKAVGWTDKHRPMDEELRRFRAEAEALLGAGRPAGGGKDR
jgi:Flp pilus assembly protein TadD